MSSIQIRLLADSQLVAAAQLSAQLGYPSDVTQFAQRLARLRSSPSDAVASAEEGDGLVGWIHVTEKNSLGSDPKAEVAALVVDEKARGRGVGAALMTWAEAWAVARGLSRVLVRSQTWREDAHRFYEKRGYEKVKTSVVLEKKMEIATPIAKKKRPAGVFHYSEICEGDVSSYPESDERFSIGSPFGKSAGLKRIGVHHELLPPGRRTSFPHAERDEEEFVYVIEGTPDLWFDGELHRLGPGDGVSFPAGTGHAHTFLNDTATAARLLVVGEKIPGARVYYPLNPSRKGRIDERWWEEAPRHPLGSHDGMPRV